LEESIGIYDINTMKALHTIRDIPPNPDGLCALSSKDESSYLAYPGSAITGEIHMFDTIKLVSLKFLFKI
jgi:autophagy-related protein 18